MKKISFFLLVGLVLLALGPRMALNLSAQEDNEKSQVRISWEEFKKLLELDKDEVVLSWEEFLKLLNQTGSKYVPTFQMKDEKVVLTRDQFKKLLDQMKPPVTTTVQPPADFLLTRSSYKGRLVNNNAVFRVEYEVEIFPLPRNQFLKIPLFPTNIALGDVLIDGRKALIILENNRHTLTTDLVGSHKITVDFSLRTSLDQGPRGFSFPILQTPITSFEVEIPDTQIDVEIPTASQIEITERSGRTLVSALLSPSNSIQVQWRKSLPEVEKGPAKIYADTITHIAVEDDALRTSTEISLSVIQNTIPSLTVKIPEGYSILNVIGSGVGDWKEITKEELVYLEIPFDYPKKGSFPLTITAEKLLTEDTMSVDFNGFVVVDAIREKGFIGIELKSISEVILASFEGLDRLDVSELPPSLINRSQKPLLYGFKYLHHPYSLILDIQKHEEMPIISTVIDAASGVTLFTEDGKLIHRMVYSIRNTSKQFLELELPENAQMWSVFVGGEPAKPRINEKKVLIPLNRSRQGATGLAAFDVELIYYQKGKRFGWMGSRESMFPVPDVIISQMLWSVYLPVGYKVLHFGGTVEKEKSATGLRLLLAGQRKVTAAGAPSAPKVGDELEDKRRRDAEGLKKQFSSNLALKEEQIMAQVENEERFSQRVQEVQTGGVPSTGGLLPIRIEIPTTGQIFRFAKTIISEEPLTLNFSFVSGGSVLLFKIILVLIILLIIYLIRKKLAAVFKSLRSLYKPKYAPFILLILGIILWFFSKTLAIICLAAFALILVAQRFIKS